MQKLEKLLVICIGPENFCFSYPPQMRLKHGVLQVNLSLSCWIVTFLFLETSNASPRLSEYLNISNNGNTASLLILCSYFYVKCSEQQHILIARFHAFQGKIYHAKYTILNHSTSFRITLLKR